MTADTLIYAVSAVALGFMAADAVMTVARRIRLWKDYHR